MQECESCGASKLTLSEEAQENACRKRNARLEKQKGGLLAEIQKKCKKSGGVFLPSAKFGMTYWIPIWKRQVSSAQEIVWLYVCSLKTLPNIALQVAQTSYRWGSRDMGVGFIAVCPCSTRSSLQTGRGYIHGREKAKLRCSTSSFTCCFEMRWLLM